jgi:hypothetical protein
MGFWQIGYEEHREVYESIKWPEPKKVGVDYLCPDCGDKFKTMEELSKHYSQAHPINRPLLFVRGMEIGTTPLKIVRPLVNTDIKVDFASAAVINDGTVKVSDISRKLSQFRNETVDIKLFNDKAKANFRLVFEIAEEDHLIGVETAFINMARGRTLSISTIDSFIDSCRSYTSASRYYDGLCHYFYGVLAKDRMEDSGLRFEEYSDRYKQALDALKDFERKLSKLLSALIMFHLNDFDQAHSITSSMPSSFARLHQASGLFAKVTSGSPWHPLKLESKNVTSSEDLLTDCDTRDVLRYVAMKNDEFRKAIPDIEAKIKRPISDYDKKKLIIILGERLYAAGDFAGAKEKARMLINDPALYKWAEAMLKRLEEARSK